MSDKSSAEIKISGKSFVEAKLLKYDMKKQEFSFPIKEGFDLKSTPIFFIKYKTLYIEKKFDEYKYEFKW